MLYVNENKLEWLLISSDLIECLKEPRLENDQENQ